MFVHLYVLPGVPRQNLCTRKYSIISPACFRIEQEVLTLPGGKGGVTQREFAACNRP